MKLRLLPIFIAITVSSAVMFGGWFVYQSVAMEDPLLRDIGAIQGVQDVRLELNRNHADIELTLKEDAALRETYLEVEKASKAVLGDREYTIELSDSASDELNDVWSQALFDVAQAMETKKYSMIPERIKVLAKEHEGLKYATEMDDDNVYITLSKDGATKHVVLPRIPMTLGVWPNE